jgi:hypothetical protein
LEVDCTLPDEAGDELLLLYGRTDAALEIALVEHIELALSVGVATSIVSEVMSQWSTNRSPDRHAIGPLLLPQIACAWRDP